MKRYNLITEKRFEIADAYWISPNGHIIPVSIKHIDSVIEDPKTYGYTREEINDLHKKYNERIGQEGKARHSILINLIMKGWIRIRNYPRRGSWTINVNRLTKRAKDYIQNFASLLIKNKNDKYDIVSIDTLKGNRSYSLIDLSSDILYTEVSDMNKYKFTDLLKEEKKDTIIAKGFFHLKEIINQEIKKHGNRANLNHIDVSKMDSISFIFDESKFNGDISEWDVSNIKSMEYLFSNSTFNGDISKWNVKNVKKMNGMFFGSKFNGNISKWNVSSVKDMEYMFGDSKFNGDISKWDVSNVRNMSYMFESSKFNGNISKWNVSNVETMCEMFAYSKFNGDISKWNVSNYPDMHNMFDGSQLENKKPEWYEEYGI